MSAQEIESAVMALPLSERVSLAQTLWQSIDAGLADTDEREAVSEAIRRDEELSSGAVTGRTHEEVMQAARFCGAASRNAFAFLADPAEDIYTAADGEPFRE